MPGRSSALPVAWSTRPAISTQMVGAMAAISEATANMAMPPRKALRWPIRSPSFPPTRSSAANVMLYDVNTHASRASGSWKESRIPGRATDTMVTSIATRSIDTDVMARICQARAPICSSAVATAGTA